jgi:hypothetical protein
MVNDTRKTVCFHKDVTIHFVPNQRLLGRNEKAKLWLTHEDFAQIKDDCRQEICRLDKSINFDIFTFRGLEFVARDARGAMEIATIHGSVLTAQQDPKSTRKAIRKVYKSLCMPSVRAALENACVDEMAVKEYLSTTEKELEQEREELEQEKEVQRRKSEKTLEKPFLRYSIGTATRSRSFTKAGLKNMMGLKSVRRMLSRRTAPCDV